MIEHSSNSSKSTTWRRWHAKFIEMLCVFVGTYSNIVQSDPEWYLKTKREKLWWLTLGLRRRWQVACGFSNLKLAQVSLHWKADALCPGRGRRSSSCWERSGRRRSSSWTWRWCLCRASLRRTHSGESNCGGFEPGRRPNFSGVCEGHQTREFRVESRFWEVYVTTMSIVHESMFIFDCLSRVVQEWVDDNRPTRPFVVFLERVLICFEETEGIE